MGKPSVHGYHALAHQRGDADGHHPTGLAGACGPVKRKPQLPKPVPAAREELPFLRGQHGVCLTGCHA